MPNLDAHLLLLIDSKNSCAMQKRHLQNCSCSVRQLRPRRGNRAHVRAVWKSHQGTEARAVYVTLTYQMGRQIYY